MEELAEIFKTVTGVDIAGAIEAAGDEEKEMALALKIGKNVKSKDIFREACEEIQSGRRDG